MSAIQDNSVFTIELGQVLLKKQIIRLIVNDHKYLHATPIHLDLISDKIWIQYDGTEVGVANELVEQDIPNTDIVLAYHSPLMRQYGDFAVS